jgi:hypothetical protein
MRKVFVITSGKRKNNMLPKARELDINFAAAYAGPQEAIAERRYPVGFGHAMVVGMNGRVTRPEGRIARDEPTGKR